MSDGLTWIGDGLVFAGGVEINNVGIAAAQKDDGGVHSIHVRRKVHLLLHIGMLEADLGHRRGTAEGFVDESEDVLGVVLSDGIDELLAGKLIQCKALGGEVAAGSPLLLMMGGLGVEVIEGVLLLAHLQKMLGGILGDDAVLLVEGALWITADRCYDFVSEAADVAVEEVGASTRASTLLRNLNTNSITSGHAATVNDGSGDLFRDTTLLVFPALRALRGLRTLLALWALRALRALTRTLTSVPCEIVSADFRRDQSEESSDGDEKGKTMSNHT